MSHHGTNDTNDSIAAQMDEEEPYHGSMAEDVFESSHRRLAGGGGGHVHVQQRTPTTGLAGVDTQMGGGLNIAGRHSSISEGVASAGHPPVSQRDASAERNPSSVLVEDRMGEFNPAVGERERWAGTLGENSLMGMDGEHSTGERQELGRLQGGHMSVTGEQRLREQGVGRRERFGETTMAQSVMHESNLVYDTTGEENKDEGTNMKMEDENGQVPVRQRMRGVRRKEESQSDGSEGNGEHDVEDDGEHDVEHNQDNHGVPVIRQVPSEFAIVMGGQSENGDLGENDIEMRTTIPISIPRLTQSVRQPIEPTDSNMGCINVNDAVENDDDRMLGSGSFKNRPSDADIIAWENQIKQNAHERSMLIGDKVSLTKLVEEYDAPGSSGQFKANVMNLTSTYRSMRQSRGDGNCFFRAFIFSYLEHLAESGDMKERRRMVTRLSDIKGMLLAAGYDELVLEGPLELLLDLLESDSLTVEMLEKQLRTEDISNYIVFLLRIIASGEVKGRSEFFAPFITGMVGMGVDEFCAKCIDPMGEESDHIVLVALTNALQVPMRVVHVDGSARDDGQLDIKDFGCDDNGSGDGGDMVVHLLYRPGHYDILYT